MYIHNVIVLTYKSLALIGFAFFSSAALACDRTIFGAGWADLDGDGRDTRQEMIESADRGGWWLDRYDGQVIDNPSLLDVDHVIPLCLAVSWGADDWPESVRIRFANDPLNLIVVGRSANRSKGARPPSDWMPRNTSEWGAYLAQIGALLDKYALAVPETEVEALECYARFVRLTGKGFRPNRWECSP